MKVVCINNDLGYRLTINKIYEVESINPNSAFDKGFYLISNDENIKNFYPKTMFINLEEFRDKQLVKILQ